MLKIGHLTFCCFTQYVWNKANSFLELFYHIRVVPSLKIRARLIYRMAENIGQYWRSKDIGVDRFSADINFPSTFVNISVTESDRDNRFLTS